MPQFTSPENLARHLNDHVLTPVESHAWSVLLGDDFPFLKDCLEGRNQCHDIREALSGLQVDRPVVMLMMQYQAIAYLALKQSRVLGWSIQRNHETIGVALNGVFVAAMTQRRKLPRFKSAYLPGQCTPEATRNAQNHPNDPHARVNTGNGTPMRLKNEVKQLLKSRERQRIHAELSQPERIYYECFLPMLIHFLELNPNTSGKPDSELVPEMWELKRMLPRRCNISFSVWQRRAQEAESRP